MIIVLLSVKYLDHYFARVCLQGDEEDIEEALKFTMDVVGGKYNSAKKDNDFVYHEKEPQLDSFPEVKGEIEIP